MTNKHVVVVGGGVVGASCAYYLHKEGCRVTLIERDRFGCGASHGNCGYVSPSHVLPLAVPGTVRKALPGMFRKDSPLRIRPGFNPRLWMWLTKFALRCNERDMLETARAKSSLLNSAKALYDELMRDENFDCDWQTDGLLFVFKGQASLDRYAQKVDKLLREQFDMPGQRLEGEALYELEPALKPGIAGAYFYDCDAHLRPDRLMQAWRKALTERGVDIREQTSLTGFTRRTNGTTRITGVETNHGPIEADSVVIATGAMTPLIEKHLGMKIPIQPGKGYSITMSRPKVCPKYPMIFEEHKVAITPMKSGYRIGSTMEFCGYDNTLNPMRLGMLRRGAEIYLKEPYTDAVEEEWTGWRPMTYDDRAIIDRLPHADNVVLAVGHGMLGVSTATATGKLVSEFVTGKEPHIDPTPFRVTRF